jgi:uncharacterized membrane protein
MSLSPEERRRIYEEEKARIEAEEKLKREQPKTEPVTINLEPNIAGLLCYVLGWISGIVFLILEQKNRFVRFHAIQSIIVFGSLNLAGTILSHVPLVGGFFGAVIGILAFILWIVLMVTAYHNQFYKVPLAGDLAERFSAVSPGEEKETRDEYIKPPQPPPQTTTTKAEDQFKTGRWGRITASSFAIAWSFAWLIFLNFFNQYIAFYYLEKINNVSQWFRYPILTGDFNAWLPILTIVLILTIVAHIILIIFDRYLLREATLIVLNILGFGVVIALLVINPFDFSHIPSAAWADALPVIITVVLIVSAVGLGIGTLVSFIKLIVNVAKRAASY